MSDQNSSFATTFALSRRRLLAAASGVGGLALAGAAPVRAAVTTADFGGLPVNILEAGFETPGRPLVAMLHGFPNLAYSWRKVMPAVAAAGYYAVAPDCRGFGRTTGWDDSWDADP